MGHFGNGPGVPNLRCPEVPSGHPVMNRSFTVNKTNNFNNTLNVYKNTNVENNVNIYKPVTITNNIDNSKNITVYKPVNVTTNIDNSKNIEINKSIDNSKNIEITKNIDNSKNINASKNIEINKSIVINKNVDVQVSAVAMAQAQAFAAAGAASWRHFVRRLLRRHPGIAWLRRRRRDQCECGGRSPRLHLAGNHGDQGDPRPLCVGGPSRISRLPHGGAIAGSAPVMRAKSPAACRARP